MRSLMLLVVTIGAVAGVPVSEARQRAFLSGPSGCWSATAAGCARPVGGVDVAALSFNPSDDSVFALGDNDGAITYAVIAGRRAASGAITALDRGACLASLPTGSCAPLRTGFGFVNFPADVAAIGQNVYVAVGGGGVAVLDRSGPAALRQLPGRAGCVARTPGPQGCLRVHGMLRASELTPSDDGRHLYVLTAVEASASIAVLTRDQATGELTQAPGRAGCLAVNLTWCARERGINHPEDLELAPDGRAAYLTTSTSFSFPETSDRPNGGLISFTRDPTTGALTRSAACLASDRRPRCRHDVQLGSPGPMVVSPDGRHIYVLARHRLDHGAIAVRVGARLRRVGNAPTWPGVSPPDDIAISQDGTFVDVVGDGTVATYRRNRKTGVLTLIGCAGRGRGCRHDPLHRLRGASRLFPASGNAIFVAGDGGLIGLTAPR